MRVLALTAVIGLALLAAPAAAVALEHPDLTGTWVAVDCVVWWEHGSTPNCDQPGDDASIIHLQIGGPRHAPTVILVDTYSTACVEAGARTHVLRAMGTGTYEPGGISVVFDGLSCGGAIQPTDWTMDIAAGPQDDSGTRASFELWWDPDGDGYGHKWYAPSRR